MKQDEHPDKRAPPVFGKQHVEAVLRHVRQDKVYEERVVMFYDVLGWRSAIERAQTRQDITRLGELVRLFTTFFGTDKDIYTSSFSDNLVVSFPHERLDYVLFGTLWSQFMAANAGFFLRGGITRGQIVHDEVVVFGPALNRAYELESKVAIYPRIIFDPLIEWDFPTLEMRRFIVSEDVAFLDPFNMKAAKLSSDLNIQQDADTGIKQVPLGLESPKGLMEELINELKRQLLRPQSASAFEKIAWVYDRVGKSLGMELRPSEVYSRIKLPNEL